MLPVPAPATARLLEGKPIYSRGPALELTTPTGAAIVAALAEGFGAMPAMTHPLHRLRRGRSRFQGTRQRRARHDRRSHAARPKRTTVSVIEANIDDASPQVIAWATEKLLEAGALDAIVIPAQMKKNRPGVLLQVIAPPEKREELIALIFRETTTLGVRFYTAERRVQPREWVEVDHAARRRPHQNRARRLRSRIRRRAQASPPKPACRSKKFSPKPRTNISKTR